MTTQAGCRVGLWLLCSLLSMTLGCEYVRPTMNAPLTRWDAGYGYRSINLPPSKTGSSDSLFIVASFSGGGTRASALSYGVLRELARTPIRWEGRDKRLIDELNIISALSGGSFTAAYYALYGDRIFYDFDPAFFERTGSTSCGRGFFARLTTGSACGLLTLAERTSFLNYWTRRSSMAIHSGTWSRAISGPSSSSMRPTWPRSRDSNSTSDSSI